MTPFLASNLEEWHPLQHRCYLDSSRACSHSTTCHSGLGSGDHTALSTQFSDLQMCHSSFLASRRSKILLNRYRLPGARFPCGIMCARSLMSYSKDSLFVFESSFHCISRCTYSARLGPNWLPTDQTGFLRSCSMPETPDNPPPPPPPPPLQASWMP